jgi:hypothetical protein
MLLSAAASCAMIWFGRDDASSSSRRVVHQIHNDHKHCMYVPGAGFSGFWFTLGRLQSLPDPFAQKFYCYSSGCLAIVSILNGLSMESVSMLARTAQSEWSTGQISRYHVVPQFVDSLLAPSSESGAAAWMMDEEQNMLDTDTYYTASVSNTTTTGTTMARDDDEYHAPTWLSQLNVITTNPNHHNGWGVQTTIRTPTTMADLRELLIQTAWIPLVTGDDLLYQGHMDGAFDTNNHPKCDKSFRLPAFDWDLVSNILNVNLDKTSLERLWQKGMDYAVV